MVRRGISLTEVLISMGILTLGLLGVAALFPVGSHYMQKATVADSGSAIARSAMNELVTRGMLNPGSWMVMTPNPAKNTSPLEANFTWSYIDGKYTQHGPGIPNPIVASFTRPMAEALSASLKQLATQPNVAKQQAIAKQFGNAYVIDPMWVASITAPGSNPLNRAGYAFPAAAIYSYPGANSYYYKQAKWLPWKGDSVSGQKANQLTWPIRRVTFRQPSTGAALDRVNAESIFANQDDLTVDLPPRADRPATQTWDLTNGVPMARQWNGDYSWIATVALSNSAARDMIATSPDSVTADVSVVVLHKRTLPSAGDLLGGTDNVSDAIAPERSVSASIVSTGLTGGLKDMGDNGRTSAFANLKSGNWIMLCGPHPNSSPEDPKFSMNWYQVVAIDKEADGRTLTDTTTQRLVTVRGPEWPWQPATNLAANDISNDLCVGIIKGAVAVHTKRLRLEGSHGPASGGSSAPMGLTGDPTILGPHPGFD